MKKTTKQRIGIAVLLLPFVALFVLLYQIDPIATFWLFGSVFFVIVCTVIGVKLLKD